MASEKTVENLQEKVDEVLAFDKEGLRSRSEWGKFNFEDAELDLARIFTVVRHLKTLPLEFLPEDTGAGMIQHINNAIPALQALHEFDIETANPGAERQQRTNAITGTADSLYKNVTPWIPFLAYQKGDVAKNIAELTSAVTAGKELVEAAKVEIAARDSEMAAIIEKAREASASAGAAVFTKKFADESIAREASATTWLWATIVLAVASVGIVIFMLFATDLLPAPTSFIQASPRFFLLALLLTATLWCGRMYKAFMHQAAVNNHRSLALQTFQAFSAAASDEQTKNAVLLEATHSIFGPTASGFLDGKSAPVDSGTKFVEIMKSVGVGK